VEVVHLLRNVEDPEKTRPLGPRPPAMTVRSSATDDVDGLPPGTLAGAYVLKRELAAGGGGTVYEAQHRLLGRRAAVKVLRRELASSPQMVTRFLREALAVNMIRHPNIVDIYEFGELPDGRPFYVMELLEGTDLRRLLQERGRISPAEVLELLEPVCAALETAHGRGVIHRDLKASNIFIVNPPVTPPPAGDGAGGDARPRRQVKLLDFGIAKLLHPDPSEAGLTVVGARLGTSYTMAPEQIRGEAVDERTDIYALGVVVYHLLTGQYPFRADNMSDVERQHLEAPPLRPSHAAPVAPALDAVVLRCMEKQADRRFPNARAFCDALREAVGTSRADMPEVTAQAAAIFVEVRVADGADSDSDDLLDDSSAVLDAAEQAFREAGLTLPLQTGSALIGARVLSSDAADAARERDEVLALAHRLAADLAERPGAHADLHVNVCFHVGRAIVRDAADHPGGKEIVGGEIISTDQWAPQENVTGVKVTPDA
jgi:serine/threonine-protein kinase